MHPFPTNLTFNLQGPSKKRKIASTKNYPIKPKEKAAHKATIPIPNDDSAGEIELSDQDLELLETYGNAVSFLDNLDQKGIARFVRSCFVVYILIEVFFRSKTEIGRLHQLNKPARLPGHDDDLPSIDSHDEDEEPWDTDIDDSILDSSDGQTDSPSDQELVLSEEDVEMPYEQVPRKVPSSRGVENPRGAMQRLPIKLPDGRIQKTGTRAVPFAPSTDESEESEVEEQPDTIQRVEDVSTGARFGRPAVVDVVGNSSRTARIHGAKEQIASICQEILADPENSASANSLTLSFIFSSGTYFSLDFCDACTPSLCTKYRLLRTQNLFPMILLSENSPLFPNLLCSEILYQDTASDL